MAYLFMHLLDVADLLQGLVELGLQEVAFGLALVLVDHVLGLELAELVLVLVLELLEDHRMRPEAH